MTAPALPARPRARWILPDAPDPDVVRALCDELLLPEPICRLLVARGHAPAEEAKRYLRPRLEQLLPPEQLLDLELAVERLLRADRHGASTLLPPGYQPGGIPFTTPLSRP